MKIFDPHVHAISRTTDDYERMATADIRKILEPSFWIGQPRTYVGTFLDYFSWITEFEKERAADHNIAHYAAIAVNPKEANDRGLAEEVLEEMPPFLERDSVVAVGEVGFDRISDDEEEIMRKQIEMAQEADLPILVHTPHQRKEEGTRRTINVLKEMNVDEDRVLIDHNTEETIEMTLDNGYWAGHSIYPRTKLTPKRVADIVQEYGIKRVTINSAADWGPSDPLNVPKTVNELRTRGFTDEKLHKLIWENPLEFYNQSGRIGRDPV